MKNNQVSRIVFVNDTQEDIRCEPWCDCDHDCDWCCDSECDCCDSECDVW